MVADRRRRGLGAEEAVDLGHAVTVRGTYAAALFGWVAGGLAGPVAATAALVAAVDPMCRGASDCSWGFELILVVPVLIGCFFVAGPRLVGRSGRRRPPVPGGGSGLDGFLLMLLVVAFGVPAVVAWRLRSET